MMHIGRHLYGWNRFNLSNDFWVENHHNGLVGEPTEPCDTR